MPTLRSLNELTKGKIKTVNLKGQEVNSDFVGYVNYTSCGICGRLIEGRIGTQALRTVDQIEWQTMNIEDKEKLERLVNEKTDLLKSKLSSQELLYLMTIS